MANPNGCNGLFKRRASPRARRENPPSTGPPRGRRALRHARRSKCPPCSRRTPGASRAASTSGAARRDASRAARLPPAGRFRHPRISRRPDASASAASTSPDALAPVKAAVFAAVEGTEKGLSCTDAQRAAVEAAVSALEARNPTTRPAASELQAGNWEVVYSTAPPPSNGSLGPFRGVAYQDINFADKSYVNVLSVPPADWLGARLVADWAPAEGDEDDRVWIVSFREVSVRLLGFRLFTKTFDNTTRVWDQTYVDEDMRVVRAARTMEGLTRAAARGRTAVAATRRLRLRDETSARIAVRERRGAERRRRRCADPSLRLLEVYTRQGYVNLRRGATLRLCRYIDGALRVANDA